MLDASTDDIEALIAFVLNEAQNDWNYLPPDGVRAHFEGIATGETGAVLMRSEPGDTPVIGVASYNRTRSFARYQSEHRRDALCGYLCEVAVHEAYRGQGLARKLIGRAIERLKRYGVSEIYVERHADNQASAAMLHHCGFATIDTFDDPARRPQGSRRTAVGRLLLSL